MEKLAQQVPLTIEEKKKLLTIAYLYVTANNPRPTKAPAIPESIQVAASNRYTDGDNPGSLGLGYVWSMFSEDKMIQYNREQVITFLEQFVAIVDEEFLNKIFNEFGEYQDSSFINEIRQLAEENGGEFKDRLIYLLESLHLFAVYDKANLDHAVENAQHDFYQALGRLKTLGDIQ